MAHVRLCRDTFPGCVAGAPCRVAVRTSALALCRSVAAFAPGHDTKLYRDPIHATRALRAVSRTSRSYRSAFPAVSQHCIARRLAARPSSYHDTELCIATLTPRGQAPARTPLALRSGLPYRGASRSYRGRDVAVSWRAAGRIVALAASPVCLCHDTMYCIMTKCKMGNSQTCCLHNFFFTHHLFFSFQLLENHQNLFIFFSFSSRTK